MVAVGVTAAAPGAHAVAARQESGYGTATPVSAENVGILGN